MSTARRMPKLRMVRSCTSPSSSTARPSLRHPAERHVGGADAVGAQHDLVERRRRTRPAPRTRPSAVDASARRAVGDRVTGVGRRVDRSPASPREAGRAAPPPRPTRRPAAAADVGGPGTSTSSTVEAGRDRARWRRRCPACATTRTTPVPSAPTPAAIGGRFGPSRTVSSRDSSTRTGRPCSSARRRAAAGAGDVDLAAEGAAVGQRATPARRPARTTTRRSRGRRARPTVVRSVAAQSPVGQRRAGARRRPSCAGPAPCRPPARASASVSPTAHPPAPSGTATSASAGRRVVGEAAARRAATSGADPLRRRRPRCVARSAAAARSRAGRRRRRRRRRRERPARRGSCASRCTGTGGRAAPARRRPCRRRPAPLAPSAGQAHDDARACRTRTGWRRWRRRRRAHALARRRGARRAVVIVRPATRRAGVTHATRGCAVDQHRAAPALALRAAAVLGRAQPELVAQHLEQRCRRRRAPRRPARRRSG